MIELENRIPAVESVRVGIGGLHPRWDEIRYQNGVIRRDLKAVEVDGRALKVGKRFLRSLASHFHVSRDLFRLFTPDEVFERVQQVHPRSTVRLTTQAGHALGMSDPSRPIVRREELISLLGEQGDRLVDVEHDGGLVTTTHRLDEAQWSVGGEAFSPTFTLETPLDGFGLPSVHLSLIRMVCENGLIAQAPVFRTEIPLGRSAADGARGPLGRAMECFNNEEGYAALLERLEAARGSMASVYEVRSMIRALTRCLPDSEDPEIRKIRDAVWRRTGDVAIKYGVASSESIAAKKQRLLPMSCTVYDVLLMATEVTTHYRTLLVDPQPLHVWVGTLLVREFDLEDSLSVAGEMDGVQPEAFYLN